jgi:aryl sulfotransferase
MIIWIASYPKSGNTWMRVFLDNLSKFGDDRADINKLGIDNFDARYLFDSLTGWESSELSLDEINRLRTCAQDSLDPNSFFLYKVHEAFVHPLSGLPLISAKASFGAVYIVRNPLDVAVSFANHLGRGIDRAIRLMSLKGAHLGMVAQVPQPMGTWSSHVNSWVDAPDVKVHVIRYEDMLADPVRTFTSVCHFTGLSEDDDAIARAIENSRFEALQEQEQKNGFRETFTQGRSFFRKGKAGTWREVLTPAQVDRIIKSHHDTMKRFGYIGSDGRPV